MQRQVAAVRSGEAARDLETRGPCGRRRRGPLPLREGPPVRNRGPGRRPRDGRGGARPGAGPPSARSAVPSGAARAAFSTRLTRTSTTSDGSAKASGQSAAIETCTGCATRTRVSPSLAARKRSAGGVGSAWGTLRPASRRARARRLSIRRASRPLSRARSSSAVRASACPASRRRRLSIESPIAVSGLRRSCETARRREVFRLSLWRRASRWAFSTRKRSRSMARATSRATGSSTVRPACVSSTTRTPLAFPPTRSGKVDVARAAGCRHLRDLLPGRGRPGRGVRARERGCVRTTRRPSADGLPSAFSRSPPPPAPTERRALAAASPRTPTRFVVVKRSIERS